MKMVKKSSTLKFGAGRGGAIPQHKALATGRQGNVAAVKNPKGSKGKKPY